MRIIKITWNKFLEEKSQKGVNIVELMLFCAVLWWSNTPGLLLFLFDILVVSKRKVWNCHMYHGCLIVKKTHCFAKSACTFMQTSTLPPTVYCQNQWLKYIRVKHYLSTCCTCTCLQILWILFYICKYSAIQILLNSCL